MLLYFLYRLLLTIFVFLLLLLYYGILSLAYFFSPTGRFKVRRKFALAVRRSFEFLGATYIKLGQMMSMRPDYFPQELCDELFKLLDTAKVLPFSRMEKVLKQRLKEKCDLIEVVFPEPIGSASFAQVHKARLKSGRHVAIKVQRPDVYKKTRVDLFYINIIVTLVDFSTLLSYVKLKVFYTNFEKWTREELDYTNEAGNVYRLKKYNRSNSTFRIPGIYWELSNEKILTMEVMEGVWLSDVISGKEPLPQNFNPSYVASSLIQLFLKQIFTDGFFHGDPHPGNIVLMPNGQIGLIDCGITGVMNTDLKVKFIELLSRISNRDAGGAFKAIVKIIKPRLDVDLMLLQKDYEDNLNTWFLGLEIPTSGMKDRTVTRLILLNIKSFQKHKIGLPNVVVQFYRCIIILEATAMAVYPRTKIFKEMQYFFDRVQAEQEQEFWSVAKIREVLQGYGKLLAEAPDHIEKVLKKLSSEEISVKPYVNNFLKAVLLVLKIVSTLGFALFLVLLFIKVFQSDRTTFFGFWINNLILYSIIGSLLARFLRRYIDIEFV